MTKKKKTGIFRLLQIAGSKKWLLLISVITVVMHGVLSVVPYVLTYYILEQLIVFRELTTSVDTFLFWAAISVLFSFVLLYASGIASHIAAFNILYELRCKMADKLGKLPMGYISYQNSGGLKKILSDDIERIETFVAHGIPDFIKGLALPFIVITYLFSVEWRLALISLVPLVLATTFVTLVFAAKSTKKAMQKYNGSLEEMNAGIVEFVSAMPVMKIFGQSADAFEKYSGSVHNFDYLVRAWLQKSAPPWGIFMSFISNATLPVLLAGIYLHFSGSLSLPVLFLFLILGVGYIRPILALSNLGSQLTMVNAGVRRLDEILFDVEEQKDGNQSFPSDTDILFEEVYFDYEEGVNVLKGVSFLLTPGTITALVGPSGSGKSTVARLLARFYDTSKGQISIGDMNIEDISLNELMKNVAFVFQENQMFYDSIRNNIAMGGNYSSEEIENAAKVARCHDFITHLPEGYDTKFGEEGVHLSGGEQQRIQLARAVLKDAPILVLDEATAFSDPENEQEIMSAMSELILDKTVVIVAHRLSTIAEVDQILVFDDGNLVERGRHEELLKRDGLYQTMWNAHNRSANFELI